MVSASLPQLPHGDEVAVDMGKYFGNGGEPEALLIRVIIKFLAHGPSSTPNLAQGG